ncbi:MAG: hypothetical protein LBI29_02140 [Rickettsiales bacterium]|jgi:hypothetical protein|nr:hypothetical protein [Rickettsiales bacterium]
MTAVYNKILTERAITTRGDSLEFGLGLNYKTDSRNTIVVTLKYAVGEIGTRGLSNVFRKGLLNSGSIGFNFNYISR